MNRKQIGRIVSYAFMAGAVAFLVISVANQWYDFVSALRSLSMWDLLGAVAMGIVAVFAAMLSWRECIAATSKRLPLGPTAHAFLVSQVGKYVPGSVWSVVAQVQLANKHGVSRVAGALASTIAMVIALATAVVVGAIGIFASGGTIIDYWWLIPIAVVCGALLVPRVLEWALVRMSRVHPRLSNFASVRVAGRPMLTSILWSVVCWVFWGFQLALLMRGMGFGDVQRLALFAVGAFALAWAVGRVFVFAPGGVGPREGALVIILSTVTNPADALALAVLTRVLMALFDVSGAAVAGFFASRLTGSHPSSGSGSGNDINGAS